MRLLIATHNRGKVREYRQLLEGLPHELVSLGDVGIDDDVSETGETYAKNALLKARAYAQQSGLLTLADDSGLEVDALDGAPGVRSARYAGDQADDADRVRYLLTRLQGVPAPQRTARFRCVIALVWPNGCEELVEGVCEGRITEEPRGECGFGYDPVFLVAGDSRTMAELSSEEKNRISHRARAAAKARALLPSSPDECQRSE